jgi:hypothetical protein
MHERERWRAGAVPNLPQSQAVEGDLVPDYSTGRQILRVAKRLISTRGSELLSLPGKPNKDMCKRTGNEQRTCTYTYDSSTVPSTASISSSSIDMLYH